MRNRRRVLPTSWDEVPQARLLNCLRLLLALDRDEAMPYVLLELLQVKPVVILLMGHDDQCALYQALSWMSLNPSAVPAVRSFAHRGIAYHLPADNFSNGRAIEYPLADEFYTKFLETNKESDLLKLTATLCREAKTDPAQIEKDSDIRVALNNRAEVESRAKRMSGLPIEYQMAVLLYFSGIKALVHKVYGKVLFDQGEETETEEPKKAGTLFGWWGVYMDLAENITNLEKVYQMNFHTICMMLVKKKKDADEREMQMKLQSKDFGK